MAAPLTSVPWVAVALMDLQNARPGALVTAFQGTALGPGQADPTGAVIQKCTTELLSAVGFSGRVVMDASRGQVTPDVVPPNLFDFLVEKICRTLEKRLSMPWTTDERADENAYQKLLTELRRGDYPVDATSNPGNLSGISGRGGAVSTISAPDRQFGSPFLGSSSGSGNDSTGVNPL